MVLRSSAAADGGRCRGAASRGQTGAQVAILGRRGRRPLPRTNSNAVSRIFVLRSSAAADGGRCSTSVNEVNQVAETLRSSAAADGGRCGPVHLVGGVGGVAILGRRGRRPLLGCCFSG